MSSFVISATETARWKTTPCQRPGFLPAYMTSSRCRHRRSTTSARPSPSMARNTPFSALPATMSIWLPAGMQVPRQERPRSPVSAALLPCGERRRDRKWAIMRSPSSTSRHWVKCQKLSCLTTRRSAPIATMRPAQSTAPRWGESSPHSTGGHRSMGAIQPRMTRVAWWRWPLHIVTMHLVHT